jgi:hypothetical protein
MAEDHGRRRGGDSGAAAAPPSLGCACANPRLPQRQRAARAMLHGKLTAAKKRSNHVGRCGKSSQAREGENQGLIDGEAAGREGGDVRVCRLMSGAD